MSSLAGRPRPGRGGMVTGMTTRWPYLILRGTTAALALLGVGQPVLAGGFLAGHYDLVRMHLYSGVAMIAVAVVQAVVVLFVRRAGGPGGLVGPGLMLPVLLVVQAALGMTHILLLHVPFGVLMVLGTVRMVRMVWRDIPAAAWNSGSVPPGWVASSSVAPVPAEASGRMPSEASA